MTDDELSAMAYSLLQRAIAAGRLAEQPTLETLTRIAAIVAPALADVRDQAAVSGSRR